jgi:hypothetical protein
VLPVSTAHRGDVRCGGRPHGRAPAEGRRQASLIDNPKHRPSKLVRLTRKGDARYRELKARLLAIASTMGADFSEADIRQTTEIVRRLSDETKGRSEQLPQSMRLGTSAKGEQ